MTRAGPNKGHPGAGAKKGQLNKNLGHASWILCCFYQSQAKIGGSQKKGSEELGSEVSRLLSMWG